MVMPPLRPVAVASPLPSPRVRMRGRRLETHPDAKPSAAPMADWAEQLRSLGLTEEQMRTAVKNRKAARRRGLPAEEAEEAELRKQKVRTPRRSCAQCFVAASERPASVCRKKRPS